MIKLRSAQYHLCDFTSGALPWARRGDAIEMHFYYDKLNSDHIHLKTNSSHDFHQSEYIVPPSRFYPFIVGINLTLEQF